MDQEEFFRLIATKQIKEAHITMECGCEMLYSSKTKEVFYKPCSESHDVG